MNVHDYRFLLSEQGTLKKLISETSPGNVIGRMSLEHRLKQVQEELEAYAGCSQRIKKMADNGAMCALEFQGDEFHFHNTDQVRRSENRLSNDNIQEDSVTLFGQFQGFLPNSRRAEVLVVAADGPDFLQESVGTVVSGKVEPAVNDTVKINEILNKDVTIEARVRRVGQGRPRYAITNCRLDT